MYEEFRRGYSGSASLKLNAHATGYKSSYSVRNELTGFIKAAFKD